MNPDEKSPDPISQDEIAPAEPASEARAAASFRMLALVPGVVIGMVVGVALDSILVGIILGIAIGVGGAFLADKWADKKTD
jgi:hypothetical protein